MKKYTRQFLIIIAYMGLLLPQSHGQITVSTLAGNGTEGFADGTGAAARFNQPTGVALDASGNVYVADEWNHSIRKIVLSPTSPTSRSAAAGALAFSLYPNPASSGTFTVQAALPGTYALQVVNAQGQVVQQATFEGTQYTLGTSGFAKGIYTVLLSSPQGQNVRRIVLQ